MAVTSSRNPLAEVRKLAVLVVVLAGIGAATAPAATTDPRTPHAATVKRINVERVSVRVPAGWHRLHGWLSDVPYPFPVLAVGSFQAQLSRRTCACGMPNVEHFPRNGAFVFVIEWTQPNRRQLTRLPHAPPRSIPPDGQPEQSTCDGPSGTFDFQRAGRVFQVELYAGPASSRADRAAMISVLNSLRVER